MNHISLEKRVENYIKSSKVSEEKAIEILKNGEKQAADSDLEDNDYKESEEERIEKQNMEKWLKMHWF